MMMMTPASLLLSTTITVFLLSIPHDVQSQLFPPGKKSADLDYLPPCIECQRPTECKSELIVNEVDVPKNIELPTLTPTHKIVKKSIPVYEYEIKEKTKTKPVDVPVEHITFERDYINKPIKVEVRKPVIKYNRTWIDVEVPRINVVEVKKPKPIRAVRTMYEPIVTYNTTQREVPKLRPVGVPVRVRKEVKVHNSIVREPEAVPVRVKVPTIKYRYCDKVKNIYVPDECPTGYKYRNPLTSSSGVSGRAFDPQADDDYPIAVDDAGAGPEILAK